MTTRNLFERPELFDKQTRLILTADAKPKRLARNSSALVRSFSRERSDSNASTYITQDIEDDIDDENSEENLNELIAEKKTSNILDETNYDTDIDQEQELPRDHTCKGVYVEQCRRYGVIPSTSFLRSIQNDNLTIRYCGLKPVNIKVMVAPLKINSTITKLDLRDNCLGSKGAIYITHLIKENGYIDELNLGNNDIGIHGCKAICKVLCSNRSIRILYLDGNRFNDDCAKLFADVFSQNECLTYINLNKNFFEDDSTGKIFGQSLVENQMLQELHLAWNRLSSKACGNLLKQLGTNARLTTLDLSWNGGALFAAKALNDLLKKNAIIEKIYFEHNKFNTECATYIGKGLAKNETLKILSLSGNPLESSGCYAVLRPLIKHLTCGLHTIDFIGIIVNQDFLDLVNELAGILPKLKVKMGREREQDIE
ncbi:unnamed protein product [Adineta steineri]|uniref:Uncharacterized protein n=1 Tax=Adineta steineri TaxID=433720 RepID=A0A815ZGS2_9BILA|nr:unnamed protein product [Adineta steineri]CAF1584899.1 unnamed protein product [Adineta steineri]